jgi:CubicO group peptidase (beta-lactamase class C family)
MVLAAAASASLLIAAVRQQPSAQDPIGSRVDALAAPLARAKLLSGVILIGRGDRIGFVRGFGLADWELAVPNGATTRFGIASITKAMTEAVVDQLAADGRLDLDQPVSRFLPAFPRGPAGGAATVRHLLTHRSGVPHRVTTPADETLSLEPADIVQRVVRIGLSFEPGSRESYSSAGFTCLARVIEILEGRPFDSVLAARVFRPSGDVGQGLELPHRCRLGVCHRGGPAPIRPRGTKGHDWRRRAGSPGRGGRQHVARLVRADQRVRGIGGCSRHG